MALEAFLSDFSVCYFEWHNISKDLEASFKLLVEGEANVDPELVGLQGRILERTRLSTVATKFPPSVEKTRKLFKFVVAELEMRGIEVSEEFYNAVTAAAPTEHTLQFKSYFDLNGKYLLSLAERTESICEGTTGLTTWAAAKSLLEWLRLLPERLQGHVLELGSGAGYTGIGLAKCGLVHGKLTLTDHHRLVLKALARNVSLNLTQEDSWSSKENADDDMRSCLFIGPTCDVTVQHLDWQLFNESNARKLNVNVVIGADIVFDEEILPSLVETIRLLLKVSNDDDDAAKRQCHAYIAGVVRNEKTSQAFVLLLKSQNLNVEITTLGKSPLVYLYSIS